MRYTLIVSLICGILLSLGSCGESARATPSIAGPITLAPPADKNAPAGVQTAVADLSNAVASKDPVKVVAAKVELAQERKQEPIGSLTPFYALGVFFIAIGAVLGYEGNLKLAGAAFVIAAAFVFGPLVVTAIIVHSAVIMTVGMLVGIAFLVYHYRSQAKALALDVEEDAKVVGLALEHAVAHIHLADIAGHALAEVEWAVRSAWGKAKAEAELLAVKAHLIKAPVAPVRPIPPMVPGQIETKA